MFRTSEGAALLSHLKPEKATEQVQEKIRKLGDLGLDRDAANKVITAFAETELAQAFNAALVARLLDAGVR